MGEMVTSQGRAAGQGWDVRAAGIGAGRAHPPGGHPLGDLQEPGLRSLAAGGSPTDTKEGGTGEDRNRGRHRAPHMHPLQGKGDEVSVPNPRPCCCDPNTSPTLPQGCSKPTREAVPCPVPAPCQGPSGLTPAPRPGTYLGDCPCIRDLRQHQPCVQDGVAGGVRRGPCPCAVRKGQPGGHAGDEGPVQLRWGPHRRAVGG